MQCIQLSSAKVIEIDCYLSLFVSVAIICRFFYVMVSMRKSKWIKINTNKKNLFSLAFETYKTNLHTRTLALHTQKCP